MQTIPPMVQQSPRRGGKRRRKRTKREEQNLRQGADLLSVHSLTDTLDCSVFVIAARECSASGASGAVLQKSPEPLRHTLFCSE